VLLSALARIILEENQEQNVEVAFNIYQIFFALSSFVESTPIISSYRVGSSAMNLLELALSHRNSSSEQKSSSTYGSHQGNSYPNDYLIYTAIQLLMNIAIDQEAERKMVRINLLPFLVQCVSLPSEACVLVSLFFIQNLSTFEENALLLVARDLHLMLQLAKLLSNEGTCVEIIDATVSILFNLSFLEACRQRLIELRCVSVIANLMVAAHRPTQINAIRIMYHLSGESNAIVLLKNADCVVTFCKITLVREIALQILLQNGLSYLLAHVINHQDNTLAKATKNLSEWTMQIQHELFNNALQFSYGHTWAFPNGLQTYKEKKFWAAHVTSMVRLLCANFGNYNLVVELLGALHNLYPLFLLKLSVIKLIQMFNMIQ